MKIENIIQRLIEYNNVPKGKFGSLLQKPYEDFVKANEYTVTIMNYLQTLLNYAEQKKKYKNDEDTLQAIEETVAYYEELLEEALRNFEKWHKKRVIKGWE